MPEETKTATETETETKTEAPETKPEMVSKERMDEVNTKNKELQEQNELLQQNQALINASATAPAPAVQAPEFDIYKEVGLEGPEDMPNVEQSRKINAYFQAITQRQNAQIRFVVDHPDFPKLVGTAQQIKSGQWAEPLMKAIRANPTLMATIVNSADPYAAAYSVAKLQTDKTAEGETTTKTEAEAAIDEAVDNANKVKSASNTQGGDGLSEEGRTENMSDADFIKAFNASGGDL